MIAPKMINNVIAKGCMRNINKYHHRRQNYLRDIIRCSKNNHNNNYNNSRLNQQVKWMSILSDNNNNNIINGKKSNYQYSNTKSYHIISTGLLLCGSSYGTMNYYYSSAEASNTTNNMKRSAAAFSTTTKGRNNEEILVATSPVTENSNIKTAEIILYQYKICPFCNAVKALLDYQNVPYKSVEVNPMSKEETKSWSIDGYKKVPILTIDGVQINDSMNIIDEIIDMLSKAGSISNSEKKLYDGKKAKEWASWANKTLAVLLFPNITRNFSESWQAFSYINDVPHFSFAQRAMNRVLGPVAMWAAQGKIKKKYGIEDEREALFDALNVWLNEIGDDSTFHGGNQPDIADIYTYGTIRALKGMDTYNEILETNERLRKWYVSMERSIGDSSCIEWK